MQHARGDKRLREGARCSAPALLRSNGNAVNEHSLCIRAREGFLFTAPARRTLEGNEKIGFTQLFKPRFGHTCSAFRQFALGWSIPTNGPRRCLFMNHASAPIPAPQRSQEFVRLINFIFFSFPPRHQQQSRTVSGPRVAPHLLNARAASERRPVDPTMMNHRGAWLLLRSSEHPDH